MTTEELAKIRWAPRLRPQRLKRLYETDAKGIHDINLCDEVGMTLFMRCRTYALVLRREVDCPACRTVFAVAVDGKSHCPTPNCDWHTTLDAYNESVRNHHAWPGRATAAFLTFYDRYPHARTYRQKILLIDQLVHSFHIDEKTGTPTKSVASKLFEGNKKAVVQFLDELSARNLEEKDEWRKTVAETIDGRILQSDHAHPSKEIENTGD